MMLLIIWMDLPKLTCCSRFLECFYFVAPKVLTTPWPGDFSSVCFCRSVKLFVFAPKVWTQLSFHILRPPDSKRIVVYNMFCTRSQTEHVFHVFMSDLLNSYSIMRPPYRFRSFFPGRFGFFEVTNTQSQTNAMPSELLHFFHPKQFPITHFVISYFCCIQCPQDLMLFILQSLTKTIPQVDWWFLCSKKGFPTYCNNLMQSDGFCMQLTMCASMLLNQKLTTHCISQKFHPMTQIIVFLILFASELCKQYVFHAFCH